MVRIDVEPENVKKSLCVELLTSIFIAVLTRRCQQMEFVTDGYRTRKMHVRFRQDLGPTLSSAKLELLFDNVRRKSRVS